MIKYKDIIEVENGAHFVNVDLHIHSYKASSDVTDANMTPEAIVDAAVRQELSVIAITDHNSDVNVAAAIHHANAYGGKILVIPGVEITTAHGHLLAYFSPEKTEDLSTFIAKLDLVGPKGADNTHTAKSMADVIAEAYKLGGLCIAAHIDRRKTGFDMFASGHQNWKRDIICSPGLYGLECDAVQTLDWYSVSDEGSDAAASRKAIFNARSGVPLLKGRFHLAHLQGSDSHTLANFEAANTARPWTRIKMSHLTWEAFRTALIDPTARVKAKVSLPKAIPKVRGIAMSGGFLDTEVIQFSDNLNCFIGGRGTGKSTAIRAIAYAFGLNDEFGQFENCPDMVTVFCEDSDGVLFRYQRPKSGDISVSTKSGGSVTNAPLDSFAIEYFGQGELAEVAKDPLNTPQLFQRFLDRHTKLQDVIAEQSTLVSQLLQNGASLNQLESTFSQLDAKKATLADIETKLKIAEDGKLKEIVSIQSRITSERTLHGAVENVIQSYTQGLTLSGFERDFDKLAGTAGEFTLDPDSVRVMNSIRSTLAAANSSLRLKAVEINSELKARAYELEKHCADLKLIHFRLQEGVTAKITDLKAKGLAGNVTELDLLLRRKGQVAGEINAIQQREPELNAYRLERARLLEELTKVRKEMTVRRKSQLVNINKNLGQTLRDYTVFIRYDDAGIIDEFLNFIQSKMTGTYFPEAAARLLCSNVTPTDLADWVLKRDSSIIASQSGISEEWAQQIISKLYYWNLLFDLQALAKQPKPIITVRTKSSPPKEIPVIQLSDGQRHTILLTIAMLAESNVPLIIDQPEDDLDNAFISSSIVATLRAVKEKRQVILVTHNANIAVLGDSELLLPMHRENDCGRVIERGSIDKDVTKMWVQKILEGGPEAFTRRQEIYGH